MDPLTVKSHFELPGVVEDYSKAVDEVGLWKSEEIVIFGRIEKSADVVEFGCGAGRIGINLARRGYENVLMTDFSESMVRAANAIIKRDGLKARAELCDATAVPYPDESFDAAIFGFNGLMQIPKSENRLAAMREICRVLKPGGIFVFTTHDRGAPANRAYWSNEEKQWKHGAQDPRLDEFGDIYYASQRGNIFIHSPSKDEITDYISKTGFILSFSERRSEITEESASVLDFSDDCIFWVLVKDRVEK